VEVERRKLVAGDECHLLVVDLGLDVTRPGTANALEDYGDEMDASRLIVTVW